MEQQKQKDHRQRTNRFGYRVVHTTSQAMSFGKAKSSTFLESLLRAFRAAIPIVQKDRVMRHDIVAASKFLDTLEVDPKELF